MRAVRGFSESGSAGGLCEVNGSFETVEQGLQQLQATPGAVLLDVRTPEEYLSGHLPGSVNFPLERLQTYDGDGPVFAYCRSGARSARACALLAQMGYAAINLGGILNYNGPLESKR